jgi:hypothetical protein
MTADEQKKLKIKTFDQHPKPGNTGLKFHRIEKSKDKHFCSLWVGSDLRLIAPKLAAVFCSAAPTTTTKRSRP